jgi:hypothetical protein
MQGYINLFNEMLGAQDLKEEELNSQLYANQVSHIVDAQRFSTSAASDMEKAVLQYLGDGSEWRVMMMMIFLLSST